VECGDETCNPGETVNSCPYDCGYCGDLTCGAGESVKGDMRFCAIDCQYTPGACNGFCEQSDYPYCPSDCGFPVPPGGGYCNGLCEPPDAMRCPSDCFFVLPE
jgi:hypothetical protein